MLKARQRIVQKNFVATFLLIVLLWSSLFLVFFLVPPEAFLMPIVFLTLVFLTALFTGSLIFANTRRGLLLALGIIIFMILRAFQIGNYLNLLLLGGAILSLEYYLSAKN